MPQLCLDGWLNVLIFFRVKDVDWIPYFTQTLVDEIASHVKLYRRAETRVLEDSSPAFENGAHRDEIERAFFELETEMESENVCRESVCSDSETEKSYLRDVTEGLLYFLLPDDIFDDPMIRLLIRVSSRLAHSGLSHLLHCCAHYLALIRVTTAWL